jgi:uncharacterized protein (DUF488 family)
VSTIYTVGHSSHSWEEFAGLLTLNRIEVVVDIRSAPYSRFAPQFDREDLRKKLLEAQIKYLYLGRELGGRPSGEAYYDNDGRVLYGRMISEPAFNSGIERLERGSREYRVAIMCGEEDPAHCHRRLLVGRVLVERSHELLHIRAGGQLQTEEELTSESGKPLANRQAALFAELEEDQWRSTASVSHKKAPANFSAR